MLKTKDYEDTLGRLNIAKIVFVVWDTFFAIMVNDKRLENEGEDIAPQTFSLHLHNLGDLLTLNHVV